MVIDTFLAAAAAYLDLRQRAGLRPWSEARLSTVLFDDGKKLARLRAGADLTTRTLQTAKDRLDQLQAQLTTTVGGG